MQLNRMQRYGLRVMFGAYPLHITAALTLPEHPWYANGLWGLFFLGTLLYMFGTVPGIRAWVDKMIHRFDGNG